MKELIVLSLDRTRQAVLAVLDDTLGLGGRAASFDDQTPLLGAVPELDSMAVVGLIAALEEHFGFYVGDDDIDGSTFETVGTLTHFVASKQAA
ncbi:acyl carrier protein [Uliginosibacterium gangwonense]|uniref:acyl carrier protein n=1 Tax=Uliginosibacterium gangwonense TaxID=392736 RepID=UPI0003AA6150|nr:phosphopantetheine-binding protein [Uliginosibacterium gangwonense]